jgi:uncharacterized protein YukE
MTSWNVDNLRALATDLLAQSEARQRAARRLHQTIEQLSETVRGTDSVDSLHAQKLRDHVTAVRELDEVERTLLDELDAALSQLR